jgi:hypothetical protein
LDGDGYPGHLWVVRTPASGPDEPDDHSAVVSIGNRALGEFIAAARTDVDAMAAEIRSLRAERDEFCDRVDTLTAVAKGNKRHVQEMFLELQKARAVLEQIRHLHKDSPMGPCPVCVDADAAAAGGDGLVPYPCPTGRLAGAQDCDPPHVRAAAAEGAQR